MKKNTRFSLSVYQVIAKRWKTPAILLIPAGIGLWWLAPQIPEFNPAYTPASLVIAGVGLLITLYTFLAGSAHIRCSTSNLVIQTPIYPLTFSYKRIENIRSAEFSKIHSPKNEKPARWRLYKNLWGKTAIIITLKSYPLPLEWIKLWFHPFLLDPKEKALVLLVEDWMGLSRQLEIKRTAWLQSRSDRRR